MRKSWPTGLVYWGGGWFGAIGRASTLFAVVFEGLPRFTPVDQVLVCSWFCLPPYALGAVPTSGIGIGVRLVVLGLSWWCFSRGSFFEDPVLLVPLFGHVRF